MSEEETKQAEENKTTSSILNTLFNVVDQDPPKDDDTETPKEEASGEEESEKEDAPLKPAPSLADMVTDEGEIEGLEKDEESSGEEGETKPEEESKEGEKKPEEEKKEEKTFRRSEENKEPLPTFDEEKPKEEKKEGQEETLDIDLLPEEEERLRLAKFAASQLSDKYPDLDKKYVDYFKKHAEFIKTSLKEDPDTEFDKDNVEYQRFLEKHRPKLSPQDVRFIEREELKAELRSEAIDSSLQKELKETQTKLKRLESQPQIDKKVSDATTEMISSMPDHMKEVYEKDGVDALAEKYPLEHGIANQVITQGSNLIKEFLNIADGLSEFDPSNTQHTWLDNFVAEQGKQFYKFGGKATVQDGKKFLPREQYNKAVKAGQSDNYWTFSNDQIVDILKVETTRNMKTAIDSELDRLEKAGFRRSDVTPTPKKKVEKKSAPRSRPSPSSPSSSGDVPSGNTTTTLLGY